MKKHDNIYHQQTKLELCNALDFDFLSRKL
jgi:hypothetical protein